MKALAALCCREFAETTAGDRLIYTASSQQD
jgi:hypothetical protein